MGSMGSIVASLIVLLKKLRSVIIYFINIMIMCYNCSVWKTVYFIKK